MESDAVVAELHLLISKSKNFNVNDDSYRPKDCNVKNILCVEPFHAALPSAR